MWSTQGRKLHFEDLEHLQIKRAPELPFSPKGISTTILTPQKSSPSPTSALGSPFFSIDDSAGERLVQHKKSSRFLETYPRGVELSETTVSRYSPLIPYSPSRPRQVSLFSRSSRLRKAMTFDEVTLADQPSSFHPCEVTLTTHITRNIYLKGCGLMSAAMDTVIKIT
jgi:hypothetical protein